MLLPRQPRRVGALTNADKAFAVCSLARCRYRNLRSRWAIELASQNRRFVVHDFATGDISTAAPIEKGL